MKIIAIALALCGIASGARAAAFNHTGFYGQVGGFGTKLSDQDVSVNGVDIGETEYRTGFGVGAALGYEFSGGFRTEAEVAYRRNDVKTDGLTGELDSLAGMANAYYDFKSLNLPVVPYVGAGAGFAQADPGVNDGINLFAYQFMGGVSYPFSQNVSAVLGYRYFATSDLEDKTPGTKIKVNYETHNAEAGMRIGF